MGIVDTAEFEAEVRAESYEQAKCKLIKSLKVSSRIEPVITYPIEEMRVNMLTQLCFDEQPHIFQKSGVYCVMAKNPSSNYSHKELYEGYFCTKCLMMKYIHIAHLENIESEYADQFIRLDKEKLGNLLE